MYFKPIYTDTNMCNPDLLQKIEQYVEEINKLKDISPSIPADWELVLELGEDDETDESICSYYFVRHSTRCLFWLHDFDLESILGELRGVTEKTHTRESTSVPGTRRTKHITRLGIASPVLVSGPRSREGFFANNPQVSLGDVPA